MKRGILPICVPIQPGLSTVAQAEAKEWVEQNLGASYLPPAAPQYTKKSAQDAHEAIRPAEIKLTADQLPGSLNRDQQRSLRTDLETLCCKPDEACYL